MSEAVNNLFGSKTGITVGFAILLFGAVAGYLISSENRLTTIEATVSEERIRTMEADIKINKELLIELKALKDRVARIEDKLDK